jgi:hypothetical protein
VDIAIPYGSEQLLTALAFLPSIVIVNKSGDLGWIDNR